MLRAESEQTGHPQRDSGWHRLWLDPERDPGHDDDQTGGDVGVEQVVAESTLEHEDALEAGELSWKTGKKTFWETCLGGRVVEHHEESMETCVIRSHKSPLVYSIWTELLSAKFIHGRGLLFFGGEGLFLQTHTFGICLVRWRKVEHLFPREISS